MNDCLLAKKYILGYLRGEEIPYDLSFDISGKIYCFKENFLKLVGKNPFNADIRDFAIEAIDYMKNAYPYCLALGGDIEKFENLDKSLVYYAKSRGANEKQLEQIILMLKEIRMPVVENDVIDFMPISEGEEVVTLDMIDCSSHKKYRADNLYDLLVAVSDKNIQGFINYLIVNNVFNPMYTERTMNGICCDRDQDNNLLVSEGNHRVITLKALAAIREFIEEQPVVVPMFKVTVLEVKKKFGLN